MRSGALGEERRNDEIRMTNDDEEPGGNASGFPGCSKPGEAGTLVDAIAARATRQDGGGLVFELERAQRAPQHVTEGGALAALSAPFVLQPRE